MDTKDCRLKVREIWDSLAIPAGRIIKYQGSWPEVQLEIFEGKKYDEVDLNVSAHDCFALNYFIPEATFYYLGSYLIFTNKWAEDVTNGIKFVFWDERIFHTLNILEAEIARLQPDDPVKKTLAEIHAFFTAFT